MTPLPTTPGGFGAILADPPWHFQSWNNGRWKGDGKIFTPARDPEYATMSIEQIAAMPISDIAAKDCILFMWGIWSMMPHTLHVIESWGFKYKTCAFNWTKIGGRIGLGYWTRQQSEYCLLATRGKPKRLHADVRQAILEPRREHSRKPDCTHERIERLVGGPYCELFGRQSRVGWSVFGNEATKFDEPIELEMAA